MRTTVSHGTSATRAAGLRLMAALLAVLLAAPQALEARYTPKTGFNLFSAEQDVELGKQNAAQVDKQMPILADADLNRYIQRLGQRLADKAPGPKYPYTFKIVNQKEINAFALPGGPVYVNLGTIQAADNEAQLAGVIGHEIGHVVMRHSTNQASKQMMAQLPLAVLGGKLGGGMIGQLAQLGIGFGVGSMFMKYSRDAENQADLVGAGIIHDAGYNPQAMVDFFQKLASSGGRGGPQFMSDHPNPGNRAQSVAREVATMQRVSYQADSAEFRDIKRKVGGMKALTAAEVQQQQKQQAGAAPDGSIQRTSDVVPSGNFKTLDHSSYSVSYPDNWNVYGDAQSTVTIAPKGGVSQDAIAYGMIISGFEPQQSGNANSLDDATRQLLEQIRQSNPNLRQVGQGENFRLNGRAARSVVMVGPSPLSTNNKQENERDWLVTMQRSDGVLIYAMSIAPERDFSQLQPTFQKMLRSLKMK